MSLASTDNKNGINISTLQELSSLNTSYNIRIINDITFTANDIFNPIALTGKIINIDGGGNTVNINTNNKIWYGLFKVNNNNQIITIKNLRLNFISTNNNDFYIIANNSGGILGDCSLYKSTNPIKIENCSVTGNINIAGANSGGIIGTNSTCMIVNCCTLCNITGRNSGGITGANSAVVVRNCFSSGNIFGQGSGGIIGGNSSGTITNCKSMGNINNGSGGIAGDRFVRGTISNCYTLGDIMSSSGGIIAGNTGMNIIITNCYVFGLLSANSGGIGGINCISLNISWCYILTAIGINVGPGQLIISGSISSIKNVGEGASEDWNIENMVLFDPIVGFLNNGPSNDLWVDSNFISPPSALLIEPPILKAFTVSPWDQTTFYDTSIQMKHYSPIPVNSNGNSFWVVGSNNDIITPPSNIPPPIVTPPLTPPPSSTTDTNIIISDNDGLSTGMIIIIVILSLLLIIGIGIGIYFYIKYNKEQKNIVSNK